MPLLGKTSFTRQNPPPGLKPDDDVFFCKVTGEVFSDYTKFFDQSILCNSVIWTCAITGKHNLTFQEAKDSEAKALQTIVFSKDLQRPLLFLASLTRRRNASDITEDLYRFAKKRFFIGEVVDVVVSGTRKSGIIKKIMAAKLSDTDDLIEGDSEEAINHSGDANEVEDALSYQYIVQETSIGSVLVVDAQNISRKRGGITREKCGLFVRQHCSFSSQKGFWTLKTDFIERFKVRSAKFSDFFVGPTPAFEKSPMKKPTTVQPNELNSDDDDDDDDDDEDDFKMEKEKMMAPKESRKKKKEDDNEEERLAQLAKMKEKAEKQEQRDALKKKAEEEKVKKKEEKHKIKEEKKEQEKILREWNKPREDLSCEDLKDLPLSTPVTCLSECFGDVLMVLEYLRSFKASFDIDVPSSLSVAALCQSIVESKVDGLFANLVQQLLEAIFHMELEYDDRGNVLGIPLKKLQLDGYSLTEILRRHFTKAAQLTTDGSNGGLGLGLGLGLAGVSSSSFPDETTSEFLQLHPSIVQKMAKRNIFDLSSVDKLKIVSSLINQLLMFPTSRALIEDNYEKVKQVQRNLRIHQIAVQKRERDEIQYTAKKKFEERMKEQSKNSEGLESSNLVNGKPSASLAEKKDESGKKTTTTTRKKRSITELSEKDFEKMPVENIDWDQLSVDEKKCIKDWSVRKEKELVSDVAKLQPTSAIFPIGRDRLFRRYWLLPSVAGIFVEDDDEFVSNDCLSPVKQKSSKPVDDKSDVKANSGNDEDKSDIKVHSGSDEDNVIGYMSLDRQLKERGRVRWSFYRTTAELDALILSLNPRGIREGPLRQALEEQKEHLVEWMMKKGGSSFNYLCTASKQNAVKSEDVKHEPAMSVSSSSNAERGCRNETAPTSSAGEACLEKALREMLLDMEERIHFGSLGVLKVRSRIEWRQELEKCVSRSIQSTTTKSAESCDQSDDKNLHSSAQKIDDDSKEALKVNSSRQEKDVGEESVIRDLSQSVIRDLSQVLLQVLKMIETKYLNPPLGEDEETRKAKQKLALERQTPEANEELNKVSDVIDNEPDRSAVENWMESVGAATSLSQLYVLLSVLETSVAWSKSALHARCRICRRKNDGEHMLLCDGCDRGHHMYCLKPPITVVPSGDWFCPSCRPKDFVHLPSTPRKSSYAEDSESESSEDNTTEEDEEEEEKEEGNGKDEKEEEEEEEEARSTSGSHEDLEISLQTKDDDEDDDDSNADDDDDDDDDDYRPKTIDNKNGSTTKSSSSAHKRGKRGRGGSSKRWKQDDYDDDDDDDDDDANGSRRSSVQKLHSTRARRNESKRSCSKRSQDRRKVFTPEATTSSSSSVQHGKRKSSSGVIVVPEPNAGQKRTRGRPPRLSLESAISRGKRKIPSDWNEDDADINMKRKKYSPIKSHFRAAENSMTVCEELVKELIKNDSCWPFRRPVTQRDAVDYFDIVKQPMDFQTIQNKIYRYQYFTSSSLLQDIHLIFYNCFLYNKPGTPVHSAGGELEDFFNRRCKELNLGSQSQSSSKHRKRTM